MKNEFKYIISLVMILSVVMVMVSGGTFAYYSWQGSDEQRTEVVFTVEQEFSCAADGGGNITHEDVPIAPASCTNSKHVIKREVKVKPTITGGHTVLMNLWLDINEIGTGLSNSRNFRYALTTDPNSCTNGIVETGNFYGTQEGDEALILNRTGYTSTTVETYYLYIWLDSEETSRDTMLQEFDFSINGMCTNAPEPESYFVFNQEDATLSIYKRDSNTSLHSDNDYSVSFLDNSDGDSASQDVTSSINLEEIVYSSPEQIPWYEYRNDIKNVVIEDKISPVSTAHWFSGLENVEYIDVRKLDTSNVTNMRHMFRWTGFNADNFEIIGLDYFNTSKVTDMSEMFNHAGRHAISWNIGDLSDWDVSNVTSMLKMFQNAGRVVTTFDIGDLSDWDVSNVVDMTAMFAGTGYSSKIFDIGDLSNWDVSNVTSMYSMFMQIGYSATTFDVGNLSEWDVSNVTIMQSMFWDAGRNATTFNIGDLSSWDVSNVTDMYRMFYRAGYSASTFNIGDLSNWNVSNVTNMSYMFSQAGVNAEYSLDLSGWNVGKVTAYDSFNAYVESKITPPVWVN